MYSKIVVDVSRDSLPPLPLADLLGLKPNNRYSLASLGYGTVTLRLRHLPRPGFIGSPR
jgi:hypothetical protein